MSMAHLRSGAFHYRIEGKGPPLVLVHGVGADLENWDAIAARLASRFTILRYDQRGHGASEKVPGPYSLDDLVGDLAGLVDHAGFERFTLAGFSLGGLVAQAFTLAFADRVDRLILISTVAARTEDEKAKVRARLEALSGQGAATHVSRSVERWFTDEFRKAHPEVVAGRQQRSLDNDPACYAAAYAVLAESDLADRLNAITCPCLVMTGECDIGSTPRMARAIADRVAGAEVVIFPRLKHSVLLEAPALVADQIERFGRNI